MNFKDIKLDDRTRDFAVQLGLTHERSCKILNSVFLEGDKSQGIFDIFPFFQNLCNSIEEWTWAIYCIGMYKLLSKHDKLIMLASIKSGRQDKVTKKVSEELKRPVGNNKPI